MGVALVTLHIVNACQKSYGNAVLAIEGLLGGTNKSKNFNYKVERANV